jgi:hypothetical protein
MDTEALMEASTMKAAPVEATAAVEAAATLSIAEVGRDDKDG